MTDTLNESEIDALYLQHQRMIRKAIETTVRKNGLTARGDLLEELEAEANLIFCQAAKTYNPAFASFGTYLYECLKGLHAIFYRKQRNACRYIPKDMDLFMSPWEESDFLEHAERELSSGAFRFLTFCMSFSREELKSIHHPSVTLPRLYLERAEGESLNRGRAYFKECRRWFRSRRCIYV